MKSISPRIVTSGTDGRLTIDTSSFGEDASVLANIDTTIIEDETGFASASSLADWDNQIKLRKIKICDENGNVYNMVVLGTGFADEGIIGS